MGKKNFYQVEIIETLAKIVAVEAEDEIDAIIQVRRKYRDCDIVLYPDDSYIDTEFKIYED